MQEGRRRRQLIPTCRSSIMKSLQQAMWYYQVNQGSSKSCHLLMSLSDCSCIRCYYSFRDTQSFVKRNFQFPVEMSFMGIGYKPSPSQIKRQIVGHREDTHKIKMLAAVSFKF